MYFHIKISNSFQVRLWGNNLVHLGFGNNSFYSVCFILFYGTNFDSEEIKKGSVIKANFFLCKKNIKPYWFFALILLSKCDFFVSPNIHILFPCFGEEGVVSSWLELSAVLILSTLFLENIGKIFAYEIEQRDSKYKCCKVEIY